MTDFLSAKSILGPVGLIEIACALPIQAPERIAIICHPHPLFGGAMGNKVVTTLERCFRDLACATLRFNFRGVGASAGIFDDGIGESDDLAGVYAFARMHFPAAPLWLAGFSFGSFVAARMANSLHAQRLVCVAPAVTKWDFAALDAPRMPWMIVQGEQDEIVAPQAVYDFAAAITPPPRLLRLANASHFFHGQLAQLRTLVTDELSASATDIALL
jgi:uncharacterized protein